MNTSDADKALYDKAKSQGTTFTSRDDAAADFSKKYSSQYKTTGYTSEPKSRPDYVPASTNVGGQTYKVEYIPAIGGYGYYVNGRPTAYDVMMDAAMLSLLMNNHNYYYGPAPVYSGGGGGVLVFLAVILILCAVVGLYIYSRRGSY